MSVAWGLRPVASSSRSTADLFVPGRHVRRIPNIGRAMLGFMPPSAQRLYVERSITLNIPPVNPAQPRPRLRFDRATCRACPARQACAWAKDAPRQLTVQPRAPLPGRTKKGGGEIVAYHVRERGEGCPWVVGSRVVGELPGNRGARVDRTLSLSQFRLTFPFALWHVRHGLWQVLEVLTRLESVRSSFLHAPSPPNV
jgi:hypothetical protein